MATKKTSKTGIISVEKPTWFPLIEDTGEFPVYGAAITIGTAVSINPSINTETAQDYGDSVIQDQFTAFGGAEISLTTNGYTHKVLSELTGGTMLKGGILRSGEDVAPDGAFAYRRKKTNGKYRYTVLYKGQFSLSSDETSTLEGSSVTFTHPEWTGSFVDVPGLGYIFSVDEDDEEADASMISAWFEKVANPKEGVAPASAQLKKEDKGE